MRPCHSGKQFDKMAKLAFGRIMEVSIPVEVDEPGLNIFQFFWGFHRVEMSRRASHGVDSIDRKIRYTIAGSRHLPGYQTKSPARLCTLKVGTEPAIQCHISMSGNQCADT
jgi:hypothetical protein